MDSKRYVFLGLLFLGAIYFVSLPDETKEPLDIEEEIAFASREPSSDTINESLKKEPVNRIRIKKPLKIKIKNMALKVPDEDLSCVSLAQSYSNQFYEKNRAEISKTIGEWYFSKEAVFNENASVSDTEKFFYALAQSGLLAGGTSVLKNIENGKKSLLSLHESNPDNMIYLITLYYLEEDVDLRREHFSAMFRTRFFQNPIENIYKKIFSLVESGEDYLGATELMSKAPVAAMAKLRNTMVEKNMYFVAQRMAEASLNADKNLKSRYHTLDYITAKMVMNKLYPGNIYETYRELSTRLIDQNKKLDELIIDMSDECNPDVVWSAVHDNIKQNFQ